MSTELTYDHLLAACRAGGASVLTSVTHLLPAAGPHAAIAPARYVQGPNGVYAYETRFIDGQPMRTVIVDGKSSTLNRMEAALVLAMEEGQSTLERLPRVSLTYEGREPLTELDLPHRVFDGHIRAGHIDGTPTTQWPEYRALRDATPANARPLLEASPISLAFGAWDSTRKSNQVRFPSAIRGEVIGVLADQDPRATQPRRGGARKDDVAPSVRLSPEELDVLVAAQRDELGPKLLAQIEEDKKKAKGGRVSASRLGLGAIPPTLETLGLVACSQIIRSHVLSFATLRQLRFGTSAEGNAACRALLAALALDGMARSDAELTLRANCDLKEQGLPVVRLDQRYGEELDLAPITIERADALLAEALAAAEKHADLDWHGQVMQVSGSDLVVRNATADVEEDKGKANQGAEA